MSNIAMPILDLLKDQKRFHTELQLDRFITTQAGVGHPYGMYIQALRELDARFWDLLRISCMGVEFEEDGTGKKPRSKVEVLFERLQQALQWKDRVREFARFYAQATGLRAVLNVQGPADLERLELDLWLHKLKVVGAIDLLTTGRLSRTMLEIIPTLPKGMREELWQLCKDPGGWMDWYQARMKDGVPELPMGPVPTQEEAEELLRRSYVHVLEISRSDSGPSTLRLLDPASNLLENRDPAGSGDADLFDGSSACFDSPGRESVSAGIGS